MCFHCRTVCNFGQEWEVSRLVTKTQYRAGLRGEINATVGLKIGLRSVNITLKGIHLVWPWWWCLTLSVGLHIICTRGETDSQRKRERNGERKRQRERASLKGKHTYHCQHRLQSYLHASVCLPVFIPLSFCLYLYLSLCLFVYICLSLPVSACLCRPMSLNSSKQRQYYPKQSDNCLV